LELHRNFSWGYTYLWACYEATSNYVAAIEAYRTADLLEDKVPEKVNAGYNILRQTYKEGGQQAYFRKCIELIRAQETLPEDQKSLGFGGIRELAGYYAQLGEKEQALELLEAHFDEPQMWHQIKFLWWFDPLHDQDRYKALVKRAGLEP